MRLWAFWGLMALPLLAQMPQDNGTGQAPRLRLQRADKMRIIGEAKSEKYILHGNVIFLQGKSRIFCQNASFSTATQFAELRDSVYIEDTGRILYGDRVDYHGKTREAWATGHAQLKTPEHRLTAGWMHYKRLEEQAEAKNNVELVDFIEGVTLRGQQGFYDKPAGYGCVTGGPMFMRVDSTGGDTLWVWGRRMEAWADSQRIEISDSVRIVQGSMLAHSEKAFFWAETGRMLLIDTPIVFQEAQELKADTIEVHIDQSRLSSGKLIGHAQVQSTDTSNAGTMTGARILFDLPTDSTRYVQIIDQATSTYRVPDTEDTPGENSFTGDHIDMFFRRKKLIRMRILSRPGLSTGKFIPRTSQIQCPVKEETPSDSNRTPVE